MSLQCCHMVDNIIFCTLLVSRIIHRWVKTGTPIISPGKIFNLKKNNHEKIINANHCCSYASSWLHKRK